MHSFTHNFKQINQWPPSAVARPFRFCTKTSEKRFMTCKLIIWTRPNNGLNILRHINCVYSQYEIKRKKKWKPKLANFFRTLSKIGAKNAFQWEWNAVQSNHNHVFSSLFVLLSTKNGVIDRLKWTTRTAAAAALVIATTISIIVTRGTHNVLWPKRQRMGRKDDKNNRNIKI